MSRSVTTSGTSIPCANRISTSHSLAMISSGRLCPRATSSLLPLLRILALLQNRFGEVRSLVSSASCQYARTRDVSDCRGQEGGKRVPDPNRARSDTASRRMVNASARCRHGQRLSHQPLTGVRLPVWCHSERERLTTYPRDLESPAIRTWTAGLIPAVQQGSGLALTKSGSSTAVSLAPLGLIRHA